MVNVYLGTMSENPLSNIVGEDKLTWFKSSSQYRALDTIDGESMEFECNIFQGFTTLQLCNKIQELRSRLSVQPENFTGRIIFMSMFNDISWWSKDNEKECELSAKLVSICAKRFSSGRWSFLGPDQTKNGFLFMKANHKKIGTESQSWWWSNSAKADSQSSDPRVHNPVECSKAKVVENYQYTSALMRRRLKQFFAQLFLLISSVYAEQSQIRVKNTNLGMLQQRDLFLATQSDPLFVPTSVMKTLTPSTDDPAQEEDLLQKYQERTSCHNKIVWLNCVLIQDSWQRLMSDSTSWQHWRIVTIYRVRGLSWVHFAKRWKNQTRQVGFEGTQKMLEITTRCLQGEYGVEITPKTDSPTF